MRLSSMGLLAVAALVCGCTERPPAADKAPSPAAPKLQGKKAVLVIASKGFRDEELAEPRKILLGHGASVALASTSLDEATGVLGAKVRPDVLIDAVDPSDFDAVVFVGGPGASEYYENPKALDLCRRAAAQGKVLAAICIAPGTLANAGVLKGKKATVWEGRSGMLEKGGATYTGKPVEVDGHIITADGPQSAAAFGQAIVDALSSP